MNEIPTGARSDWAPAPSVSEAPASKPAALGAGKALVSILWGLIIVAVDIRIDGFDLLVDAFGYWLITRGSLTLSSGKVHLPERAAVAFRSMVWASVILAVFSIQWVVVDQTQPDLASFSSLTATDGLALLSAAVIAALHLVILLQLLSGIMIIATEQESLSLYGRASTLRAYFAAFGFAGPVLAFAFGTEVGVVEFLVFVAVQVWLYLQLWSTTKEAAKQLSLPIRHAADPGSPASQPLIWRVLFGFAAILAVWTLVSPADAFVETMSEQPEPSFGFETDRQQGESVLSEAVARQEPGLVVEPAAIRSSTNQAALCGSPVASQVVAIDTATAKRVWAKSIPNVQKPPAVNGDTVFITDPWLDQLLPSVSALDINTGEIRWQHFVEAQEMAPWGSADDHVTFRVVNVGGRAGSRLVDLDATGAIVNEKFSESSEWSDLPESRFVAGGPVVKASIGAGPTYGPHLWLRRNDGSLFMGDAIPFNDTYTAVGNQNSLGDPVQVGEQTVLVTLGSHRGPNNKVVAYNASDGTVRWELEHLRSAAVATLDGRDVVVYDKRNTKPANAVSTRGLYVVEAADPSDVIWSAELSVNDDGGNGFLGSTGSALIFATPYPEPIGAGLGVRFTTITGESDAPERIAAAPGFGGGASSLHHLSDDLLVAAVESRVTWQGRDGSRSMVEFSDTVQHVSLSDGLLLAVTGQSPDECG